MNASATPKIANMTTGAWAGPRRRATMAAAPEDLSRRMVSGARDGPEAKTTTAIRSDPRARRGVTN